MAKIRASAADAGASSALVRSIVLFGSVARGEAGASSDVDLMVWIDWNRRGLVERELAKESVAVTLAKHGIKKIDITWIDRAVDDIPTHKRLRFLDVQLGSTVLYGVDLREDLVPPSRRDILEECRSRALGALADLEHEKDIPAEVLLAALARQFIQTGKWCTKRHAVEQQANDKVVQAAWRSRYGTPTPDDDATLRHLPTVKSFLQQVGSEAGAALANGGSSD